MGGPMSPGLRNRVALLLAGGIATSLLGVAPAVGQNRFYNLPSICSNELLPTALVALALPIDHPQFQLVTGFRFWSDIAGGVIVLEAGMISDLASIPQGLQNLLSNDDPRISAGAWVHDLLCDRQGKIVLEDGRAVTLTHTQCAQILAFEAMLDLGANWIQRNGVFHAVNLFGPKF